MSRQDQRSRGGRGGRGEVGQEVDKLCRAGKARLAYAGPGSTSSSCWALGGAGCSVFPFKIKLAHHKMPSP